MITVLLCAFSFVCATVLHIFACRYSPDKNLKSKLFLQISAAFLFVFIVVSLHFTMPLMWACIIIYILLVPAYLVVYVTTELVSPSKRILMSVANPQGVTYAEIIEYLEKENLITSRLDELVISGCLTRAGDWYILTSSGRSLAAFLDIFGKLLGRGVGG